MTFLSTLFFLARISRLSRSEERRVGKEGRSRWAPYHLKKKKKIQTVSAQYNDVSKTAESAGVTCVVKGGWRTSANTGIACACAAVAMGSVFFFQAEDGIRDA